MTPAELLAHFGTMTAVARACGIAQPSVQEWFISGHVPHLRQWQIELGTRGKLKAELRPFNGIRLEAYGPSEASNA